jgi:hypothetical protein
MFKKERCFSKVPRQKILGVSFHMVRQTAFVSGSDSADRRGCTDGEQ